MANKEIKFELDIDTIPDSVEDDAMDQLLEKLAEIGKTTDDIEDYQIRIVVSAKVK
jgi:hypothetical protein